MAPTAHAGPVDVLLLAAHAPELSGLPRPLAREGRTELGRHRVLARTTGVGAVEAAAATATWLERLAPRAVVLLGSCGIYPQHPEDVLDTLVPSRLALVEPSVLTGRSALPEPMPMTLEVGAEPSRGLAACIGAHRSPVATTLGITVQDSLARRLGRAGHHAENLEAFAVARACARAGVPFSALLVATNLVGARGRAEWHAHRDEASKKAGKQIRQWLRSGAPGLAPPPAHAGASP